MNNQVTFDFMSAFSRFEYVLKALRFCKSKGGYIIVLHEDYIRSVDQELSREISNDFLEAKQYYLNHPPMIQVCDNDKNISWSKYIIGSENNQNQICYKYLRCVRNNLFHGGKAMDPDDSVRNYELLYFGIALINTAIRVNPMAMCEYNTIEDGILKKIQICA